MSVFDFTNVPDQAKRSECTYTIFQSNKSLVSSDRSIVILDNHRRKRCHHSCEVFASPNKQTTFELKEEDGTHSTDILQIDARFVSLLQWLGENYTNVRLSGENRDGEYTVYKIREIASGGGTKLSAEDGFLQLMIDRLLASSVPADEHEKDDLDETGDDMKPTSLQSITDFMICAGRTMPDNIQLRVRRNLTIARSHEVSPEERRRAQCALSVMMNIQWRNNCFETIDPQEVRRILDEELCGVEHVKQGIIEAIMQINRIHTFPTYSPLLVGPAGTGKSQIAHVVAHILKLPWATLDMSSINDPEQLTGNSRIYANARPGIIMEALSMVGEPSLVFIVNEPDKAVTERGNGNPADVLLTLLDSLGFMDNYIECTIPTVGIYPITMINDKAQISAPLMSRFAIIDIPDYIRGEKKIIFSQYALPKVLERMSMNVNKCIVTEEALYVATEKYSNATEVRGLEQAAEHITANALYQIEANHVSQVTFSAEIVRKLLE